MSEDGLEEAANRPAIQGTTDLEFDDENSTGLEKPLRGLQRFEGVDVVIDPDVREMVSSWYGNRARKKR